MPPFLIFTMDKKVTMQDVAEAAGVSKSTVSFILNGRDDLRISEQTKKKVWQVINMLNYRPNLYAKNLRGTQMNKVIAFFMGQSLSDLEKLSFFSSISSAAFIMFTAWSEILSKSPILCSRKERVWLSFSDRVFPLSFTR